VRLFVVFAVEQPYSVSVGSSTIAVQPDARHASRGSQNGYGFVETAPADFERRVTTEKVT